jgi:hypothetical protein
MSVSRVEMDEWEENLRWAVTQRMERLRLRLGWTSEEWSVDTRSRRRHETRRGTTARR